MKKAETQKGITLLALIITVIVLCILAATAIGTIQRDGLISKSQDASDKYNQGLKDDEAFIQEGESILDEVLSGTNSGNDSSGGATPESVFLWKSDDPSSPDYGVVIGYTENIQNYPSLRFPDRCTKISIEFPENIDGNIKSEMRSYTHNIKEIELPETVTEIGAESFYSYEFRGLEKIIIPDSVTAIGKCAFDTCGSLTTITIPSGVTEIEERVFSGCALISITIPSGVTTIGSSAFSHCDSLTSITIPNSVTTIGKNAFSNCYSLTSITIPNGITEIKDLVFSDCEMLTTITIPEGVTKIGYRAFCSCDSLTTITIPKSVTKIDSNAFESCTNLTSLIFNGTTEEWKQVEWHYRVA